MSTPVIIAGISAPDSELTRKASSLIERVHNKSMLHHVQRTWWFAEFLGKKRGLKYDREVVYLASVMHDLGLTEEFCADNRFEVDGADAARKMLTTSGYADAKAQQVWEAIALHSALGVAERLTPETCLVCLGAHVDVFGMNIEEISPALIDETIGRYPRLGFKNAFQQAVAEVARKKPQFAIGTGLADVAKRHVHGFSCGNVCDLIDAAPFAS